MSAKELLSTLSDIPFWDVDKDNFDVEAYPGHLIQKILEYGNLNDWRAIRAMKETILQAARDYQA